MARSLPICDCCLHWSYTDMTLYVKHRDKNKTTCKCYCMYGFILLSCFRENGLISWEIYICASAPENEATVFETTWFEFSNLSQIEHGFREIVVERFSVIYIYFCLYHYINVVNERYFSKNGHEYFTLFTVCPRMKLWEFWRHIAQKVWRI